MCVCVCSLARSPEGPAGLRVARFLETPCFSPFSFFSPPPLLLFHQSYRPVLLPPVLPSCCTSPTTSSSQPPSLLQPNLPTDLKFTQHSCRRCTFLHLVLLPPPTPTFVLRHPTSPHSSSASILYFSMTLNARPVSPVLLRLAFLLTCLLNINFLHQLIILHELRKRSILCVNVFLPSFFHFLLLLSLDYGGQQYARAASTN